MASQDHFQGDRAIKTYLPRTENNTHAATADFVQQFVIAKGSNRCWFSRLATKGCVCLLSKIRRIQGQLEQTISTKAVHDLAGQFSTATLTSSIFHPSAQPRAALSGITTELRPPGYKKL